MEPTEHFGIYFGYIRRLFQSWVSPFKASQQVTRAASAANSMLGRIKRTFTCMDKEMFLPLYKTLVRPPMENAIQAWSPYLQKDIAKLEKVQRGSTKLVPSLTNLPQWRNQDFISEWLELWERAPPNPERAPKKPERPLQSKSGPLQSQSGPSQARAGPT